MRLLLDTNVIIWSARDSGRLTSRVREIIASDDCSLFISVMSAWEYGQKRLLKPLELPFSFESLVDGLPHQKVDFPFPAAKFAEDLPLIHRDPFDRMLIAQAILLDLTIVTSDADIHKYPVKTFW